MVDDVFAILDAYKIERSILAAESAGAAVALGAALKSPERISGLVIVDGLYFQPTPEEQDPFLAGLRSHYAETLEQFVQACVPEKDSEPIKRWGRQILERASPDAAIALYRMASTVDLRNDLKRIHQPTLVLHGDEDRLVPIESAQWLVKALPNAKLTILSGAGHVPTMTQPQAVAQEIANFFG
jgi:pimeloyl-ACP methyl ester carboxylesterase